MEKIDRILHDLDQGNTNLTYTKKLLLNLISDMLNELQKNAELIASESDDGKSDHSLGTSQGFESGADWIVDNLKDKLQGVY